MVYYLYILAFADWWYANDVYGTNKNVSVNVSLHHYIIGMHVFAYELDTYSSCDLLYQKEKKKYHTCYVMEKAMRLLIY